MISKKIIFGLIIILICSFSNLKAQSNHYFHHNTNWSISGFGAETHWDTYFKVNGDTILGGDTLVKIIMHGAMFHNPWEFWGFYGSPIYPSFLAKDSAQIVTLYQLDLTFTTITDTIINDYGRTDSVSHRILGNGYTARAILDTTGFDNIGGINRKQFDINNEVPNPSNDFVYEGLFDKFGQPFIEGIFEYGAYLTCFDATVSPPFDPLYQGNCIIATLSVSNASEPVLHLFPNPTTRTIFMNSLENLQGATITISNSIGQITYQTLIAGPTIEINVENMSPGMYIMNCTSNYFNSRTVFIKN